jgi:hypothetical protein
MGGARFQNIFLQITPNFLRLTLPHRSTPELVRSFTVWHTYRARIRINLYEAHGRVVFPANQYRT